jgi:hypothetical protein
MVFRPTLSLSNERLVFAASEPSNWRLGFRPPWSPSGPSGGWGRTVNNGATGTGATGGTGSTEPTGTNTGAVGSTGATRKSGLRGGTGVVGPSGPSGSGPSGSIGLWGVEQPAGRTPGDGDVVVVDTTLVGAPIGSRPGVLWDLALPADQQLASVTFDSIEDPNSNFYTVIVLQSNCTLRAQVVEIVGGTLFFMQDSKPNAPAKLVADSFHVDSQSLLGGNGEVSALVANLEGSIVPGVYFGVGQGCPLCLSSLWTFDVTALYGSATPPLIDPVFSLPFGGQYGILQFDGNVTIAESCQLWIRNAGASCAQSLAYPEHQTDKIVFGHVTFMPSSSVFLLVISGLYEPSLLGVQYQVSEGEPAVVFQTLMTTYPYSPTCDPICSSNCTFFDPPLICYSLSDLHRITGQGGVSVGSKCASSSVGGISVLFAPSCTPEGPPPGSEIPDCTTTGCLNGGTCIFSPVFNLAFCKCPALVDSFGFSGLMCESPVCNCQGRGSCTTSEGVLPYCECYSGFAGPQCETPLCPGNCNGRGVCDTSSGRPICDCTVGSEGLDCNVPVPVGACPSLCTAGCNGTEECSCGPGWVGAWCQIPTCDGYIADDNPVSCSASGLCLDPANGCQCYAGYGGADCSEILEVGGTCTASSCSEHGECTANNTACACYSGWTGVNCSIAVYRDGSSGSAGLIAGLTVGLFALCLLVGLAIALLVRWHRRRQIQRNAQVLKQKTLESMKDQSLQSRLQVCVLSWSSLSFFSSTFKAPPAHWRILSACASC